VYCINIHERRIQLDFFRLLMFETQFVPLYDGESWYGLVYRIMLLALFKVRNGYDTHMH
jgi:hypothetical protein